MRVCVLHGARDLRLEEREAAALGPSQVRLRFGAGGICGSDLHYYGEGRVGDFALREPLILGHEVAGEVIETGRDVGRVRPGDRVAVNPSLPCWQCRACQAGRTNLCRRMTFLGSAAVVPHIQGAFQEQLVVFESQCVVVPHATPYGIAALAEPLAVCLHAVRRAGDLLGRQVLITGSGPIGALTAVAARLAGAVEIVITDVAEAPLAAARRMGADTAINVTDPAALTRYAADKGYFDVVFEASGNGKALLGALPVVRPTGIVVIIGIGEEVPIPISVPVVKEIELRGTFRFHDEFALSVELISAGRVDLMPLVSATIPLSDAREAFELAADRSRAMKVQLAFA
jgi:L-idonate 5-dehydrogenase